MIPNATPPPQQTNDVPVFVEPAENKRQVATFRAAKKEPKEIPYNPRPINKNAKRKELRHIRNTVSKFHSKRLKTFRYKDGFNIAYQRILSLSN